MPQKIFQFGKPQAAPADNTPSLTPGLSKTKLGKSAGKNVLQQMTGEGSAGLRAGNRAQDTALAEAARNMRAQTGASIARSGNLGQGSANQQSQFTEGNILSQLSSAKGQQAQALGAEQERGTRLGADLALRGEGQAEASRQFDLGLLANMAQLNPALHAKLTGALTTGQGMEWTDEDRLAADNYLNSLQSSEEQDAMSQLLSNVQNTSSDAYNQNIMADLLADKSGTAGATGNDVSKYFEGGVSRENFDEESFLNDLFGG